MQYEEASARLKDLTTINVNLSNVRNKLEQELSVIASDYDEVSKELKVRRERERKKKKEKERERKRENRLVPPICYVDRAAYFVFTAEQHQ